MWVSDPIHYQELVVARLRTVAAGNAEAQPLVTMKIMYLKKYLCIGVSVSLVQRCLHFSSYFPKSLHHGPRCHRTSAHTRRAARVAAAMLVLDHGGVRGSMAACGEAWRRVLGVLELENERLRAGSGAGAGRRPHKREEEAGHGRWASTGGAGAGQRPHTREEEVGHGRWASTGADDGRIRLPQGAHQPGDPRRAAPSRRQVAIP
jgi:hypothetical protein